MDSKAKNSKRFDVDKEIADCDKYEVCEDPSGEFYTKYLMKTEMGKNQNKYYVLQLLKHKTTDKRYIWTRYGRVSDSKGQKELKECEMTAAEKIFVKKFKEKTGKSKGYIEIDFKLGKVESKMDDKITNLLAAKHQKVEKEEKKIAPVTIAPSKLKKEVQSFVSLIFDKKMMEASVLTVGFDLKKLPLDQLTESTLKNGYVQLGLIDGLLKLKVSPHDKRYAEYSAKFYMYIPHNFGF